MNKIENLVKLMPQDVDAVLVRGQINRFYFTNFDSTEGAVIVTKNGAFLLLDARYFEMAKNEVKGMEIVCFSNVYEEIKNVFKKNNVKTVAIETKVTSINQFKEYEEKFAEFNFRTDTWLDDVILNLRAVKTEEEIEKIKKSQEIVDEAFTYILKIVGAGKTEKQISREIESFILDRAQAISFPSIVVSGKNTSLPHGVPSNKVIERGDFVTMDFGALLDGYCSDMTRTVCVGVVSDFQKELYNTVLKAQEVALNEIKEGLICNEVDGHVREFFKQFGYVEEFGHGLGHGVGLEIHEDPYFNKICKAKLKENMILTVEPGLYIYSKMGLRIEDMIVVKKEGILNLTKSSKELFCI